MSTVCAPTAPHPSPVFPSWALASPTYWSRAGWSRKSFWERKGRKTPPPIPDPDGRGRARGTERKRAPPGPRRGPAPAATLRRGVPGIIPNSPPGTIRVLPESADSRSAVPHRPESERPRRAPPAPRPGRPRAALTGRRFGVAARARGRAVGRTPRSRSAGPSRRVRRPAAAAPPAPSRRSSNTCSAPASRQSRGRSRPSAGGADPASQRDPHPTTRPTRARGGGEVCGG